MATKKAPRKRSSTTKKRVTRRRTTTVARRTVARARPATRRIVRSTTSAAMQTAIGVGGAVASAAAINALPIKDPRAKALTQLGMGLLAFSLFPKNRMKNRNLRIAAAGMSLAGALALVKNSGLNLPLLAGNNGRMGLNYYPNSNTTMMGRGLTYRSAERATSHKARPIPMMGINKHYGGMAGPGYGGRFITQANM